MRIGGVGDRPAGARDVATALSTAVAALGQRPAITSHGAEGRYEQGFVSLAGWAAKGANMLRDEYGLVAGDRLGVASPPGWPLAAVTLAAWWLGVSVVPASTPGLRLYVRHVATAGTPDDPYAIEGTGRPGDVLWIGDALDGTGTPPTSADECWTDAVIPHPDRAPDPIRDGTVLALEHLPSGEPGSEPGSEPGRTGAVTVAGTATQEELLSALAAEPGRALGILRHDGADLLTSHNGAYRLAALVLRPLVTGAASVVAPAGVIDLEHIAMSERVSHWIA